MGSPVFLYFTMLIQPYTALAFYNIRVMLDTL